MKAIAAKLAWLFNKGRSLRAAALNLAVLICIIFPAAAQSWKMTGAPVSNWVSVACSADGNHIAALAYDGGSVYISTNAGNSWNLSKAPDGFVLGSAITSSADGTILAAANIRDVSGDSAGNVYISTNSGTVWVTFSPNKTWMSIACSADGSMLAGACFFRRSFGGGIEISTDSGSSWAFSQAPDDSWQAIASSADGMRLVAADSIDGAIHISSDGGSTWTPSSPQPQAFSAVASSADGRVLAVASDNNGSLTGPIYTSTNFGATWGQTAAPLSNWVAIACSMDATTLVAAGGGSAALGHIYTSTNSGLTWNIANAPLANWTAVACSADGKKLVATAYGGHIYTLQLSPFTPAPSLKLSLASGQPLVSWTVPSSKFVLQETSDLNSTNWTNVESVPSLNLTNLENQVTASQSNGPKYYRLRSL